MTTITTQAQTTQPTTRTGVGAGLATRTWRYVAVFAAGAALSVGVGISAATDHHTSAPTTPARASTSAIQASTNDQCPLRVGRPC